MSLVTCGLAGDGVYSAIIPFSTTPYLTTFDTEVIEQEFLVTEIEKEFSTAIPVIEFGIDIIEIEECSWPAV